jgi:polyphosphate:AMP phosphotransferase
MLESIDLEAKVEKDEYQQKILPLKTNLRELQHLSRQFKVPIILLLEGWDTAGKGDGIQQITEMLDPRAFEVHYVQQPAEHSDQFPWLHEFWNKLPERGRMAFFERSWYARLIQAKVGGAITAEEYEERLAAIQQFEKTLLDDGYLIVKIWLHLSKKQQRRRLKQAEEDPYRRFVVTEAEWAHHHHYDTYLETVEDILQKTHLERAPWSAVAAANRRHRRLEILQMISGQLEKQLHHIRQIRTEPKPFFAHTETKKIELPPVRGNPLGECDLASRISSNDYAERLEAAQIRIRELQQKAYVRKFSTSIVFEGWDAAGKGGAIKRLVRTLDPRGYSTVPVGKPTLLELDHHYLWRFWTKLPRRGQIAIYDRSWYGRVLVERVEGFAKEEEWKRAYEEINAFEAQLHREGMIHIKFWLHISKEEQLVRFKARSQDPHKLWKLTEEDWRNRDKWDAYVEAVNEMILRTNTPHAPWTIVSGNDKYYARVQVIETVCQLMEYALE